MLAYIKNFVFYIINKGAHCNIKKNFVTGRGFYGKIEGFDYKAGKLILLVFDYGMYFPRHYDKNQLYKNN